MYTGVSPTIIQTVGAYIPSPSLLPATTVVQTRVVSAGSVPPPPAAMVGVAVFTTVAAMFGSFLWIVPYRRLKSVT